MGWRTPGYSPCALEGEDSSAKKGKTGEFKWNNKQGFCSVGLGVPVRLG